MVATTAVLATLLPALAAASPLKQRAFLADYPYTTGLEALRSASPIHFSAVNASLGHFFIGKATNTYCPVSDCSGFPNITVISIYEASGTAYMSSNVPGGQNVFVAESGALSFTEPHQEYVFPDGSYSRGFEIANNGHGVDLLNFTGGGATTFTACPPTTPSSTAGVYPYQVFLDVKGFNDSVVPSGSIADCLPFGIAIYNSTGAGAFQYE